MLLQGNLKRIVVTFSGHQFLNIKNLEMIPIQQREPWISMQIKGNENGVSLEILKLLERRNCRTS